MEQLLSEPTKSILESREIIRQFGDDLAEMGTLWEETCKYQHERAVYAEGVAVIMGRVVDRLE